jgi:hypothetical protein
LFACQCGSACGLRHDVAGSRHVDAGSRRCSGSVDLLRTSACLFKVRSSVRVNTMDVLIASKTYGTIVLSRHHILGESPSANSSERAERA